MPTGPRRGALLALAVPALAAGCALKDLTSAPKWDIRFNFPTTNSTIGVSSMLPNGVTIAGANFAVTVNPVTVTQTLGQACPSCVPLNGQSAPKPAFTFTQANTTALPTDVVSASLATGTLSVNIANGFGFDPLNVAGATSSGTLVITVTDGAGKQVAKDSVNGATTSLPANGTLVRTLTLATGTTKGPLSLSATVNSPAGGNVTINTAQVLTVTATPQNITASSAQVNITNKAVNSAGSGIDLSSVNSDIRARLGASTVYVTIANPFGVTGTMNAQFISSSANFTKPVALTAGTSTQTIALTASETQSITGSNVTINFTGTVTSATPVTVSPADQVVVTPRIEVSISTEKP